MARNYPGVGGENAEQKLRPGNCFVKINRAWLQSSGGDCIENSYASFAQV
jgi:hypothetical protein